MCSVVYCIISHCRTYTTEISVMWKSVTKMHMHVRRLVLAHWSCSRKKNRRYRYSVWKQHGVLCVYFIRPNHSQSSNRRFVLHVLAGVELEPSNVESWDLALSLKHDALPRTMPCPLLSEPSLSIGHVPSGFVNNLTSCFFLLSLLTSLTAPSWTLGILQISCSSSAAVNRSTSNK